jgi:hypothetical protein
MVLQQEIIVPYEPLLGGGFVCIITQFLRALVNNHPGGMLTWSGVILVSFPFNVVGGVEAGRAGARGPIRYCVVMGILAQLLGVCVVIPALWIPSYIFGGSSSSSSKGAHSPQRPWHAVYTFAIPTVLTVFIFTLDSSSVAWRQCAGLLGGPLLAFLPLLYYLSPPPRNVKEMQQNQTKAHESYVNALKLVGVLSFVSYIFLVYIAVSAYGFHVVTIFNGFLWKNAHPAVKFMIVDTTGFFLATLIYAYLQSPLQMLKMAMLLPLLGPGAAFSYVMVEREPNNVVPKDDNKQH